MNLVIVAVAVVAIGGPLLIAKYDQADRDSRGMSCDCHPAYHALGVHEPGHRSDQ